MTYKEKTAKRLLKLRLENGLTQKELAEKVGTSSQNIDLYESGKRKINIEILGKVADVFNVSTDYLLGRTETATMNEDIKAICEFTGLSEEAVKKLSDNKLISAVQSKKHTLPINYIFDILITSQRFYYIIILISRYREFTERYVKSIIDNKTEETEQIIDKLDLEKFRMFEELKDFFEKEFSNPAFFCAKNYYQFFYTWHQRKSDGKLCMPLVPPAPLRSMLPPYPESLPIEQVEELKKNEPTQEEIDKYNLDLQEYEQYIEQAQNHMKKIREKYEETEYYK